MSPSERYLQRTYGISQVEWKEMFEHQQGLCAICLRGNRKLVVDHNGLRAKGGNVRESIRGLT
jgi:hypothetical protein